MQAQLKTSYRFVPNDSLGGWGDALPSPLHMRGTRSYFDLTQRVVVHRKPVKAPASGLSALLKGFLACFGLGR